MKIDIYRQEYGDLSTPGEMFIDGQRECFTLEPAKEKPAHPGHPCIPAGMYLVKLTPSPHLKYVTPEILDVPGRSAIRIHIANVPADLLGCTAVGDERQKNAVSKSKIAFDRLMTLLKFVADQGEQIVAEWHDPLA